MAAQILSLGDALVSRVISLWDASASPMGSDDSVERLYFTPIDLTTVVGRKVFLFVGPTYENSPVTRGEDEWIYTAAALIVERYEDAGSPTKAWTDTRVEFVQNIVSGGLDFVRELLVIGNREISTQVNTVTVYDPDKLVTQKLFYSEVVFEFRETLAE